MTMEEQQQQHPQSDLLDFSKLCPLPPPPLSGSSGSNNNNSCCGFDSPDLGGGGGGDACFASAPPPTSASSSSFLVAGETDLDPKMVGPSSPSSSYQNLTFSQQHQQQHYTQYHSQQQPQHQLLHQVPSAAVAMVPASQDDYGDYCQQQPRYISL